MSHFAEIDENGIVKRVIVAEQNFIDSGVVGDPKNWLQTSYNTTGGAHASGGISLRKNYAGVGYAYDKGRDAFIPPKPYASWILDEESCQWKAPIAMPNDEKIYVWNEILLNWKSIK